MWEYSVCPLMRTFTRVRMHTIMERYVQKGGRAEVWDRETMFAQLVKRSLRKVVSGHLQYFTQSKCFRSEKHKRWNSVSACQLFSEFSIWEGKSAFELKTSWNRPSPQKRLYVNKDTRSPYNNPAGLIQSFRKTRLLKVCLTLWRCS